MSSLHLSLTLTHRVLKFAPTEPPHLFHMTLPSIAVPFSSLSPSILTSPLILLLTFLLSLYFSPALCFDSSPCPTSVPPLLCVVSQALRVLCIPQTQCHPFILHQETLTPIIWRVHKAAQPLDPEDEGRIETDGQSAGRKMEREADEGDLILVWGWKYMWTVW